MRKIENRIVPECYVDAKVAEILGEASEKYNHQHGCGNVSNKLKYDLANEVALGIIDEDKNKGHASLYFSNFEIVREENNLILKKHESRNQFFILICPEIEKWLLADAEKVKIKPDDEAYKLPGKLKDFNQISKRKDIDKNGGFYRFVKALIREQSPSVTTLKNWIELFKQNSLG